MAAGTQPGLLGAIRIDLRLLHETWMAFLFPRQRNARDTVLGRWQPDTLGQQVPYYLWAVVGILVVAVVYPLLLAGYFVRYQTRTVGAAGVRLGLVGVVVLVALVWGGLTALVAVQSGSFQEGAVTALALASGVAVVSAALSYLAWRVDGRPTTILLAYPFAVTAIFLPPVVAALFWERLDGLIQFSDDIAYWVTNEGPDPLGIVTWLEENFERQDEDHVLIWFAASFPVGWTLGLLVTLADLIRPRSE
jgi:drug/metabolite transporter (DMT)-like permease